MHFTLKITLILIVLLYIGFAFFALLFAERLAFPAPLSSYTSRDEFAIKTFSPTGSEIISYRYLPSEGSNYLIIYSAGNAEDLGHIDRRIKILNELGFSVLAWEYPGYGLSPGSSNEKSVKHTAERVWEFALENTGFSEDQIIMYGRSIGGFSAIYTGTVHKPAAIITESSFTSVFRVPFPIPLLPWDLLENKRLIKQLNSPVLILHGTEDETVPFHHGPQLYEAASLPKKHVWFEGGMHNNLPFDHAAKYGNSILEFVQTLPK